MEIKNLYTLKTILEEGSFGNAANKLGYTQSTITFQIRQLEDELGVVLFEKIGRRMILSRAGENLIPYVNETLASFEKLQNVGKSINELNGTLNIILSETLLCYKLEPVISEFHRLAPKVELKLRSLSCHATKQALLEGNADLGICYDQSEIDERLCIHSLGNVTLLVVSSNQLYSHLKDTLDFTAQNISLPTSFITDEPDGIFRRQFEKYLKTQDIQLAGTIELWSTSMIKSLVKSGLGISFLPSFTVEEELSKGGFISLAHHIPCENIRAIYMYHKNKSINKPMQLFIDLLEQYSHL